MAQSFPPPLHTAAAVWVKLVLSLALFFYYYHFPCVVLPFLVPFFSHSTWTSSPSFQVKRRQQKVGTVAYITDSEHKRTWRKPERLRLAAAAADRSSVWVCVSRQLEKEENKREKKRGKSRLKIFFPFFFSGGKHDATYTTTTRTRLAHTNSRFVCVPADIKTLGVFCFPFVFSVSFLSHRM